MTAIDLSSFTGSTARLMTLNVLLGLLVTTNYPKNGSSAHAVNREMVMIVQHEQRSGCRSGSPGG